MDVPLSTLIRSARQHQRLSQDDVAAGSGVSRQTISLWEREVRGENGVLIVPTLHRVLAVTTFLKIPKAEVLVAHKALRKQAFDESNERTEVA